MVADNWVWRSLVARVDGVHEAAGSTPVTQTRIRKTASENSFRL